MSSETEYSLITFKVAHETVFPFLDDAKELKKLLLHRFRWQSVVSVRDLTYDSRSIKAERPLNCETFDGPDDIFTKYLWAEHQIFDADVISTPNGWKLDLPMPRKKRRNRGRAEKNPKIQDRGHCHCDRLYQM